MVEDLASRIERLASVGSTNDVARERLRAGSGAVGAHAADADAAGADAAGADVSGADAAPAVVVVADEQTAGRGRDGRTWTAPPGRALLCSLGFRPIWLAPTDAWRLAATVSLAMADAAEEVAGLREGTIRLKWPNDLVVETEVAAPGSDGAALEPPADRPRVAALPPPPPSVAPGAHLPIAAVRKLGGVLGETAGLGTAHPEVVVGIGVNADWAAADFPPELAATMTSLREVAGGRPVDRDALLDAFLDRLDVRLLALRDGRFDGAAWLARQLTNGRLVRLELPDGTVEVVRAAGVDPRTGALLVTDPDATGPDAGSERPVTVGEIVHLRLGTGV
ncbi:MAG: hypothetical protein RL338_545 [Chloroflexota bacterium]